MSKIDDAKAKIDEAFAGLATAAEESGEAVDFYLRVSDKTLLYFPTEESVFEYLIESGYDADDAKEIAEDGYTGRWVDSYAFD